MVPLVLAVTAGFADPGPPPPPARPVPLHAPAAEPPAAPHLPPDGRAADVPQNRGEHAAATSQPACPSTMTAHPFQRLPRVCPVPSCLCAEELLGPGQHDGHAHAAGPRAADALAPKVLFVKEFDQAASIPLPRFTAAGCPLPTDGLVIYEGMRLVVYYDGGYELSFTATVPDMLVVLRLQLVFADDGQPDGPSARRITLPPIRMAPGKDHVPGEDRGVTFSVSHRGYSSLFAPGGAVKADKALYRIGTARFGTPIALEDPYRY